MKKMIVFTSAIVLCLFMLDIFVGKNPDRRSLEFMPDMVISAAYKAESPNPYFLNGRTQQNPAPGSIVRGYKPLHFGASVEESLRAGQELSNPLDSLNAAELERGKKMYQIYCQVCHGAGGEGNGPVTRRGYPPPPSLLQDNARNMKDGQIFHIMTNGYKNMPSYGAQIARQDRWLTVSYIRKLQETQP